MWQAELAYTAHRGVRYLTAKVATSQGRVRRSTACGTYGTYRWISTTLSWNGATVRWRRRPAWGRHCETGRRHSPVRYGIYPWIATVTQG